MNRKQYLPLLACLLLLPLAQAAVSHASTTSSSGLLGTTAGSVSFTHDSGSGSDRFLVVALIYDHSQGQSVSGITYGGVALTPIGTPVFASNRPTRLFVLTNPSAGTQTVQINHGSSPAVNWAAVATTYNGVDQAMPYQNYNTASGVDGGAPYLAAVTITSQASDLVYAATGSREAGRTWTAGAGQTERGEAAGPSGLTIVASDETGATSTSMDFEANDFMNFATLGFSIIPSEGGAPPPTPVCGNGAVESGETCDNGASNGACPAGCSSSCTTNTCSVPDTTAPTQVTGLTATATSSSQINLAWSAASDTVGVTGYRIYRDGTQITTTASTSYSSTGLTASTTYSYTIAAYDAAGNVGTQSSSASATTQASTPPPTGNGLTPVFYSDWRTAALGVDGRADNSKWNELGGYGLEVVPTTGLDFPFANVVNITAYIANSGFGMNRKSGMSIPAVGTTRHYRWYVQMNFPDELMGNGDHPWQDGNAIGDVNWFIGVHYGGMSGWPTPVPRPGQWRIGVFIVPPTGGSIDFSQGPWLDKEQTYRVEVILERLTAETYDFDIYVYDSSNTLLYDSADFPAAFGGGTLATRGPYTLRFPNNLDGFNMGVNDFYPVSGTMNGAAYNNNWWTSTFHYGYQGGFAVVDGQRLAQVGPYGLVTGEVPVTAPTDTTPPTATITAPTAAQVLTAGTTQTTLTVTTNEAATCRWSATDVAYSSMTNTLAGATTTSHTATLTGLTNGQTYTRYVRCQDTATAPNTMTSSVSVSFSVANPGATCGNGVVEAGETCDNGASNDVCPATCSSSCTTNTCNTYRAGDLNQDGTVNILDVTLIIQNFKRRSNYDTGADINNDGTVNIFDMVLLGRNWGSGSTPPTGQLTPVFFSDWRTQLGNSVGAIQDGGKWNSISPEASQNGEIVIAPAGEGFPMAKVLRVYSTGVRDGWLAPQVTTLGELPIGQTRNYRFYYSMHEPDGLSDDSQHPIQDGGAISQNNIQFDTESNSSTPGRWYFYWGTGQANAYPNNRWYMGQFDNPILLQKGRAYRFELQMYRIDATTWRMNTQVFDDEGTLVAGNNNFYNPARVALSTQPLMNYNIVANTGRFMIGLNGIGNTPPWPIHHANEAGFAIVDGLPEGTFIGPYGSVVGEVTG